MERGTILLMGGKTGPLGKSLKSGTRGGTKSAGKEGAKGGSSFPV